VAAGNVESEAMDLSFDLLGNALVSGLLLGGFYAAVTIGVSISFGLLDIVNIVNTIAMPLIGGTSTWLGPLIGAVLLGTLEQLATVTISSELSLLLVGVLLVIFVVAAPRGIVGWIRR
jgi:branched-chain amino acid transport system permease protein